MRLLILVTVKYHSYILYGILYCYLSWSQLVESAILVTMLQIVSVFKWFSRWLLLSFVAGDGVGIILKRWDLVFSLRFGPPQIRKVQDKT